MPCIRVGIRIRPDGDNSSQLLAYNEQINSIQLISNNNGSGSTNDSVKHEFNFDKIFSEQSTQHDIFNGCTSSIVDEVLEGYNGCIFAYGQTGAGKTYTMSGPPNGTADANRGLCMRTVHYLFKKVKIIQDQISFKLSVMEIYNELLIDLLLEPIITSGPYSNPNSHPKLTIVDTTSGVIVPNLQIVPINNEHDALNLLYDATANRSVAEHQLNRQSSRSHVIYTFYVTRTRILNEDLTSGDDPEITQSKLHLVDLAGSERTAKTNSMGTVQKEANYINRSLSYLEQVVVALTQSKRDHIPYRQSKLTYLLKDSLGGNCNTYLIACIWPHQSHMWETLSTLRFSARMKCIETNPIRNSLITKEKQSSRMLQQIELLKKELILRDSIIAEMKDKQGSPSESTPNGSTSEFNKVQRLKTYKQCYQMVSTASKSFEGKATPSTSTKLRNDKTLRNNRTDIDLSEMEIDFQSIPQIQLIVGTLKAALWEASGFDPNTVQRNTRNAILVANPTIADRINEILLHDAPIEGETEKTPKLLKSNGLNGTSRNPSSRNSSSKMSTTMQSNGNNKIGFNELGGDWKIIGGPSSNQSPVEPVAPSASTVNLPPEPMRSPSNDLDITKPLLNMTFASPNGASSMNNFESYKKSNEGKPFHASYEDAKDALSVAKTRQREIVAIMNQQKAVIDSLTVKLMDDYDQTVEIEQGADVNNQLITAKRTYREAYLELKLCKEQIVEMQSLKKRALASLVNAYAEYENKMKQSDVLMERQDEEADDDEEESSRVN